MERNTAVIASAFKALMEKVMVESEEHPISLKFPKEIEILSKCLKKN